MEGDICINLTWLHTGRRENGMDHQLEPEITVNLNSDTFALSDSDNIRDQLQPQIGVRVQSEVVAYATVGGDLPPPDVFLQIVQDVLPLSQIYINIISPALYDLLTATHSRQGRGASEGVFEAWATDSNGNRTARARVVTDDRGGMKDLFAQLNEAAAHASAPN